MVRSVADALTAGGCSEVVAVGGDTVGLGTLGFDVTPDLHPGEGPLGGVITALASQSGADIVVVVGCDTPFLDGPTVATLVAALRADPSADVAIGRTDRRQPLCAAWRPGSAPALVAAFTSGERAVHRAVASLNCVEVSVPHESVRNVNTPDDLNG